MILFFPQYQAGCVPSRIPIGTPDLRALLQKRSGFVEVPLVQTNTSDPHPAFGIRFYDDVMEQQRRAAEIISAAHPDFIVTTGGDCGASYASIAHLNKKYDGKMGVLWIDAHADIHVPSTSPSGHYHGMVLRHLMGAEGFGSKPDCPLLPHQIAYLGLRDTERQEDDVIAENHIPRFDARDVMAGDAPLDAVLSHFKTHGLTHLHLHVDCDVLDAEAFPHVHVPETGGLTLDRLIKVLQHLRKSMPMAGCCLTEYAPMTSGAGMDVMERIYRDGLGVL